MKDRVYPKCSATTVMAAMNIPDRGDHNVDHGFAVEFRKNPNAVFFQGTQYYKLRAWICGTCGYTELYVDDPQALYEAYQNAQQRQQ